MIILDTHIWIWWIYNDARLNEQLCKVATARIHDCPLLTVDNKILDYPPSRV